nr:MAG TPA: hypothetical protein [Caudoviricetes sp.]
MMLTARSSEYSFFVGEGKSLSGLAMDFCGRMCYNIFPII